MLNEIIKNWKSKNGVVYILHTVKDKLDNDFDGKFVNKVVAKKSSKKLDPLVCALQVVEETKKSDSMGSSGMSSDFQEEIKKFEKKPKSSFNKVVQQSKPELKGSLSSKELEGGVKSGSIRTLNKSDLNLAVGSDRMSNYVGSNDKDKVPSKSNSVSSASLENQVPQQTVSHLSLNKNPDELPLALTEVFNPSGLLKFRSNRIFMNQAIRNGSTSGRMPVGVSISDPTLQRLYLDQFILTCFIFKAPMISRRLSSARFTEATNGLREAF